MCGKRAGRLRDIDDVASAVRTNVDGFAAGRAAAWACDSLVSPDLHDHLAAAAVPVVLATDEDDVVVPPGIEARTGRVA